MAAIVVALALLASAASADAAVLYDQYNNPVATSGVQSDTATPSRVADDFVVPGGQVWTINGVDVLQSSAMSVPSSFNVDFYANGAGDLPNGLVASRPGSSYTAAASDLSIALAPPVVLTSGTYWVSPQAVTAPCGSPGCWFWNHRSVASNAGAAFEDPNGNVAPACVTFMRKTACGYPPTGPDQVFRLNGTASPARTLTVTKQGSGLGTVGSSPPGIACGATCSAQYADGTSVTLVAAPTRGSKFTGWGGACSGTGACYVTMNGDRTVAATFTATGPNTKITKARINQRKRKATFRFKAIGSHSGFQCKLIGQSRKLQRYRRCSSPKTYKHLKVGKHTFKVRAWGPGGPDPTPAKKKFRIRG